MDDLSCQEDLSRKTNAELVEIIIRLLHLLTLHEMRGGDMGTYRNLKEARGNGH